MISDMKAKIAARSRAWRADLLRATLSPPAHAAVLDLGGGKGTHMAACYPELRNVHIADFNPAALAHARERHGFTPHLVDGNARLPFTDGQFDLVFCSSVIEHVTGEKEAAIELFKSDGARFRREALKLQSAFAAEIRRIGRTYFVQTPARSFPVEVHSWLPLIGLLPTHWQWRVMRLVNRLPYPRKDKRPDWSLLTYDDMRRLFPDATIYRERAGVFTKGYIAIGKGTPLEATLDPSTEARDQVPE